MTMVEQNYARFRDPVEPAEHESEPDFWQATDEDDAARLRANEACTKALAALFRAAEEVAAQIVGDDYRDAILNLEAEIAADAARLEQAAKEQYDGIATSALGHFERMPGSMADWSGEVIKRMGEIADMAICLQARARGCPAEPGTEGA